MELVIGFVAVGAFGLIAAIAEGQPHPENKKKHKPNKRYSRSRR